MFKPTLCLAGCGCLRIAKLCHEYSTRSTKYRWIRNFRPDLAAVEKTKTANPMYGIWAKALATRSNTIVDAIKPRAASNPDNVKRVERVFTESDWDYLTQMAAPEYTYERFLRAVGKFPAFAAMMHIAHFAQETGGHIAKENISDNPLALEGGSRRWCTCARWAGRRGRPATPPAVARTTGRTRSGPAAQARVISRYGKQLSYHFNYGAFSRRCLTAMRPCC